MSWDTENDQPKLVDVKNTSPYGVISKMVETKFEVRHVIRSVLMRQTTYQKFSCVLGVCVWDFGKKLVESHHTLKSSQNRATKTCPSHFLVSKTYRSESEKYKNFALGQPKSNKNGKYRNPVTVEAN